MFPAMAKPCLFGLSPPQPGRTPLLYVSLHSGCVGALWGPIQFSCSISVALFLGAWKNSPNEPVIKPSLVLKKQKS